MTETVSTTTDETSSHSVSDVTAEKPQKSSASKARKKKRLMKKHNVQESTAGGKRHFIAPAGTPRAVIEEIVACEK